jgi:polyhydroxyalkanoate synthesis regulator phasin
MEAIKDAYAALNKTVLSNAMKKGFANALVDLDTYQLAKYKDAVIDLANLVHPNPACSTAIITVDGKPMKTLDALMKGITVTADTWEAAQSEAGQEVAKAVKDGRLSKEEAEKVLADAKNDNWEVLLMEGKLGILAALRNIRNMLKNPRKEVIDALCALVSDGDKIRNGLIMPYQLDLAYMTIETEFPNCTYGDQIKQALRNGYETALPNLKVLLTGKTCVMIDTSSSMGTPCTMGNDKNGRKRISRTAMSEAALIGATIAKACDGDVVLFSSFAKEFNYRKSDNVFAIAKQIENAAIWGGTSIGSAFEMIRMWKRKYDRIFVLSDNECNTKSYWSGDWVKDAYKKYVHDVCSPYVYCVDLASYGTTILPQTNKIGYYFGYGYSMFDDVAKLEFNPSAHIDKVRQIVIDPNYIVS